MTNPLTWRTLAGPQYDPNQTFQNAISNINQLGFGSVNKALTGYQQQEGELFTEDKAKNQQAAIEALRQYKTPEELQAAIASGAVNQLLDPMGNRVDRSKVINYADARVKDLRTDITAEQTFKNLQEKAAVAPFMDKAKALYASGKVKEGDDFVKANESLFKNNQADIINFKNEAELKGLTAQDARNRSEVSQADQARKMQQTGIEAVTTEKAAKTQQEELAAEGIVANSLSAFNQGQAETNKKLSSIYASIPNIPKDPRTGVPDFNSELMTDKMRVEIAKAVKDAGINPVEQTSASLANAQKQMEAAGLSPATIKKALTNMNSYVTSEPVESTEANQKRLAAISSIEKQKQAIKENNIFYQDKSTVPAGLQEIAKRVSSEIKDEGNIPEITNAISKWALDGMFVKNEKGQEVKIKVPTKVLAMAYDLGKETDTYFRNNTVENMKQKVQEIYSNPTYRAELAKVDALDRGDYDRDASKLLFEAAGASGKMNVNTQVDLIKNAGKSAESNMTNQAIKKEEAAQANLLKMQEELRQRNNVAAKRYDNTRDVWNISRK